MNPNPDNASDNAADYCRPVYHFTPSANWMNDPNGLVFYEGEWHLFHQHTPPGHEGSHWGHAVSTDLLHWEHLPVALWPDELGIIASGSAVVDWDDTSGFFGGGHGLVAVFTHWKNQNKPDSDQAQSIAYSTDKGRSWIKYAGNPVLPNQGVPDFRDPKVFRHGPTSRWVLVAATFDCVTLYTSPNLRDWTYASTFGKGQGLEGFIWECPDLFELPIDGDTAHTKWVLNTSYLQHNVPEGSLGACSMQYFVGDFDGTTFYNDNPPDVILPSTGGPDDYATVSWSDVPPEDGRRVWIGWMSHWGYAGGPPTLGWQGAMTVPRCVSLHTTPEGVRLCQTPARELEALRGPAQPWRDKALSPGQPFVLPVGSGCCELGAEFEAGDASSFGVAVRVGGNERTLIGYDAATSELFVDRTRSGQTGFHPKFGSITRVPLALSDGKLTLRVFVDRCSVEVFANDGAAYLAALVFPSQGSQGIEAYAEGGAARLLSLTLYADSL